MWIVYLLTMVGVYAPVLGLSFVLARWAARRLCDNPRGRAAGTLGGVLGAWLGCFEVIDLASKMGWFRESGEWVVGLIRGGLYALALGLPIGLCVGVCIGLAVWKAATGGREVRIGLLLGLALGGVLAGPVTLLVPQQYFELVDGGGMTNIMVLIVLVSGAVGAHAGYAFSRNANAPRRAGLNAALLCIAAGAILTAIMFPSIRTHTQSSAQLAETGNTEALIERVRIALDAKLSGGSFTGAPDIVALGNTGDPKAVPILAQALRSNDWNAPRAAAYALGNIRNKQSADVLLSWLQERNRTLKVDCDDQCVLVITSLAKLREKRAVPVLISLLRPLEASNTHSTYFRAWARVSWDDYVRKAAANAIAEIGGEGALPALEKASRDPDFALGSSAKDALKKLRAK